MTKHTVLLKYFLIYPGLILFIISCSPRKSYEIKSFLFDGVPNPEVQNQPVDSVSTNLLELETELDSTTVMAKVELLKGSVHKPYSERKCNDCHSSKSMGKLKIEISNLCTSCHTDIKRYTYEHGPVESNYCTSCHDPHKSDNKHLLKFENENLCSHCHSVEKLKNYTIHSEIDDNNCTSCHNAHGGMNEYFLKTETCYNCHTNYNDEFKYLHGPVESSNYCNQCHDNHKSKNEYKLLNINDNICLSCHLESDVRNSTVHTSNSIEKCTECHNPHGSNIKYLLRKEYEN